MNTIKYQEEFVVRSYEIDQNGFATLPQVANYFQEAAGRNAKDLNFDIEDLQKNNATWVLYRMHIKMESFPERWHPVTVHTWPSSGDGIRAFRDYELMDTHDNILGAGVSQWMVLNMKNRRPVRIPKEIMEMSLDVEEHKLPVDKKHFGKFSKPDFETHIVVGLHDLDMNHHVNNVKYIEWMTGFLPASMSNDLQCTELKIQYHKEAGLFTNIAVSGKKLSPYRFQHRIKDSSTGELLAEGETAWRG